MLLKIAIIGAGAAGLSCALELRRYGVTPVIFEKKSYIGEVFALPAAALRIFNPNYLDPIRHLKRRYSLDVAPLNAIEEITMIGPSKEISVKGKLGYTIKRGRDKDSIENQIAGRLDSCIQYDSYVTIGDIEKEFDYVVVATGTSDFAKERGVFSDSFNIFARSATIIGDFNENAVRMWLNNDYAKNGFAYVMPFNKKEARVTLMINNIAFHELNFYWELFLRTEGINYTMTETRDMEDNLGVVNPLCIGNIYFVGDAAGLVDDFIGFGVISAVESGFMAARSIVKNIDYIKLMKP